MNPRLIQPLLTALIAAALSAAIFTFSLNQPWRTQIDIGGPIDGPFTAGFLAPEFNQEGTFRWSEPQAELFVAGAGPSTLSLRVHGGASGAELGVNLGSTPITLSLRPGWQTLHLAPQPQPFSGDLRIELRTLAQVTPGDPRERGLAFDHFALSGNGSSGGQILLLALSVGLAAGLAHGLSGSRWGGAAAALGLLGASVTLLARGDASPRLLLLLASARLPLVLLSSCGVAWLCTHWLARQAHAEPETYPAILRRWLVAAVTLSFLLRFAGMAYPFTFVSDIRYHLSRAGTIAAGEFLELFLPNPSLTPVQWGGANISIPYSPLYYMLTAGFMFLPGDGPTLAMMLFSSLIDALAVLLVGLIVRWAGGNRVAAISAAWAAGLLPFGLITSVSWGLYPTLLGQTLALLAMAVWLRWYLRGGREPIRWMVFSLSAAFLAYPTALLFLGWAWFWLLLIVSVRRDPAAAPMWRAALLAALVALLLYYGWHVPALVQGTLPIVLGALSGSASLNAPVAGEQPVGWSSLWYGIAGFYPAFSLLLAAAGALFLGYTGWRERPARNWYALTLLLLTWSSAYIPFALADQIIPLVNKQTLHLLPALAILIGLGLGWLEQTKPGVWLAGLGISIVGWQGLSALIVQIINGFSDLR